MFLAANVPNSAAALDFDAFESYQISKDSKDCTEVRDEAAIKAHRALRNASTQAQGGGKGNSNNDNNK